MSIPIRIVASHAQDIYYGDYKGAVDFFDLDDFIANCAYSIGTILNQEYKDLYAQYRSEKKDEIIGFDQSWLNRQTLKLERGKDGIWKAKLDKSIMSFSYDKNTTGIQNVFSLRPQPKFELERLTRDQQWQSQYWPITSRVFFVPGKEEIEVFSKGGCNVQEIEVFYVPAVGEDMDVPDGLIDPAITATVAKIKSLEEGLIVKTNLDTNKNRALATEINPQGAK